MTVGERVSGVLAGQSLAWLLVRLAVFWCCAPPLVLLVSPAQRCSLWPCSPRCRAALVQSRECGGAGLTSCCL